MNETTIIDQSYRISRTMLYRYASEVDRENRFPHESIAALKEAGFMKYFVPERLGGLDGGLVTFWKVGAILGEGCLSTALTWVMHCQQVAALAHHTCDMYEDILSDIATQGLLVASVTSEVGRGGDFFTSETALQLEPDSSHYRLKHFAPVVSYGAYANIFLVKVRAGEDRPLNDVRLALVTRDDGEILTVGQWNAMGMRGTQSAPMKFDVRLTPQRILPVAFHQVAIQTMIPVIHLGWASIWYGAARGALNRFVQTLRNASGSGHKKLHSDLFIHRLAKLRTSLDLLEAMLNQMATKLEQYRIDNASIDHYKDITHTIALNNLKIAASELAFSVIDGLVELSGLNRGYLQDDPCGIERTFRDLRSAALMYSNDRLLAANGKFIVMEQTPIQTIWQRSQEREASTLAVSSNTNTGDTP